MPLGTKPVASLYKRAVYKTEFDIFKQNTDIDLISLVSLEDDPKELDFLSRRCNSSRGAETKSVFAEGARSGSYTRCFSARFSSQLGQSGSTKRRANGRTCSSAVTTYRYDKANYDNQTGPRTPTTHSYGRIDSSELSSLNKRSRTNVDFKHDKYTAGSKATQLKSVAPRRQVKSAHTARPRSEYTRYPRQIECRNNLVSRNARDRVKSAGSSARPKTAIRQKIRESGGFAGKEPDNSQKTNNEFKLKNTDCEESKNICETVEKKVSDKSDLELENPADLIDSEDSGVENKLSASVDCSPDSNDIEKEKGKVTFEIDQNQCVHDSFSACSVEGGDLSIDRYKCHFGVHDLIQNLVYTESVEKENGDDESQTKYTNLDSESGFSFRKDQKGETVEETIEATEEESNYRHEPKDITMSKEAKSVIMETLHDLKSKRGKDNKENCEDNIRFKSVTKQKRMKENRNKYDYFMRERTETLLSVKNREDKDSHYDKDNDLYESDLEDNPVIEIVKHQKLFPSIAESSKRSNQTASSTSSNQIYSLDQVKKRRYKIPGIGNYDLVASPDNGFEITPPGFDCRYNTRPILTKEELDPPPKCIQERSIQKCKKWLKNVNLSPLSLNPVLNKR